MFTLSQGSNKQISGILIENAGMVQVNGNFIFFNGGRYTTDRTFLMN